ncbi:glycolipid transfer protein (GLTP) family protein [Actinidia rufa]|uniref:Glycolipid transfer protein (GLTP) family protein n=1 Tax=Actinidia rufa TaxID=165716 RepID=A0A7J0G5K9_9ERIC|nr:glycolipid transfer protein (GLTP) family protein [Actinidia rufa]
MANFDDQKPLRKISEAFKDLANTVNSQTPDLELAPFSHACSLVSPLFACLRHRLQVRRNRLRRQGSRSRRGFEVDRDIADDDESGCGGELCEVSRESYKEPFESEAWARHG